MNAYIWIPYDKVCTLKQNVWKNHMSQWIKRCAWEEKHHLWFEIVNFCNWEDLIIRHQFITKVIKVSLILQLRGFGHRTFQCGNHSLPLQVMDQKRYRVGPRWPSTIGWWWRDTQILRKRLAVRIPTVKSPLYLTVPWRRHIGLLS